MPSSSPSSPLPSQIKSKPAATWLVIAIASGACAAFNGVFAKLTTTTLTGSWASGVSHLLGLGEENKVVEFAVRGFFFLLNLLFNAIMWALFTRALTLASSTVRVSIINTSANFMLTALLGALIFSESLPGIWWLGAAMLVAGSVVIGRRDESGDDGEGKAAGARAREDVLVEGEAQPFLDEPGAGVADEVELEPVDEDVDGVLAGPK
ncbi:uncharacterized protein J3D65DRAFT_676245 [Phyllosticta citribraziliensis]|uniref:Transmembrane protein 42 n=1 Tax=Phyllosticta citribraziliensis TaxID=989973 RepID=A0ABR1LTY1_9PEZI